jgi:hypothetical protein
MDLHVPESTLAFRESKWWTGGWTLQELLAPKLVEFYSASWTRLGKKLDSFDLDSPSTGSINGLITEITGIRTRYLNCYSNIYLASIAERLSWAARRKTTRVEDVAYSLLCIFGVNMPLLYGEKEGAFLRLQKTIISSSDDQYIFVWEYKFGPLRYCSSLLARSPYDFTGYADVEPYHPYEALISHYSMTNAGLQIPMRLRKIPGSNNTFIGLLNCAASRDRHSRNIAIPLIHSRNSSGKMNMAGPFIRCGKRPILISLSLFQEPDNDPTIPIYIRSKCSKNVESGLKFANKRERTASFEILEVYPPDWHAILDLLGWNYEIFHSVVSSHETLGSQTIYLNCEMLLGGHFVIRLKYRFRKSTGGFYYFALTLEFAVAHVERGFSLAETMIVGKAQMDVALNWQQQLDLYDGILKFCVEKEDKSDHPCRWWNLHPMYHHK